MKRRVARIAAWSAGLAFLAILVSASGVVPISASGGHWPVTEWFLQFTMRRSVSTRSLGIRPPALDDAALVLRGAGHYETACRPCHGAPGATQPVVPRGLTPRPPDLSERVPQREPQELFYVVKHGIKMTGMPAWPSQVRDDEVWAMVAFLERLPELDRDAYDALVFGERELPAGVLGTCARCHGVDGLGRGEQIPALAGQRREYLEASLRAYAAGARYSGIMQPVAYELDADTIAELAQHFAQLPPPPVGASEPSERVERGAKIARDGLPERDVPACSDCHGPAPAQPRADYPRLAGRSARYLELQLELFADGHRGGTAYAHLMREVVRELGAEERRDVAAYYAQLPPSEER